MDREQNTDRTRTPLLPDRANDAPRWIRLFRDRMTQSAAPGSIFVTGCDEPRSFRGIVLTSFYPPRTRARPTCIEPSSMTIAHSGASRSSDVPREQVVDQRLVAQPSPLGLPPHGIEHLGIDPNGDPRRRRIGRPVFAARPARADDADPFTMVSPPHGIGHDEHAARRRAAQSVLQRRRAS